MDRDIRIYRDYLVAKHSPEVTLTSVAKKHGITRNGLYHIVHRIENGNAAKINQELKRLRLAIFWKYKYQTRVLALMDNRQAGNVIELKKLIKEMAKDEFSVSYIAEMTGKDRATVLHHLEK
jgi:predicted regulator of amino acid metabolism with ACT domain